MIRSPDRSTERTEQSVAALSLHAVALGETASREVLRNEGLSQEDLSREDLRPRAADDERRKRGESSGPGSAVITRTKPQTKKPSLYRVLILNDDYTPMEFV